MSLNVALAALLAEAVTSLRDREMVGLGVDIEEIANVRRADDVGGQRRLDRLFTASEQTDLVGSVDRQAGLHAAKEAVAKSLGSGFRNGIAGRHIEIVTDSGGSPSVVLHGPAAELARISRIAGTAVSWVRSEGLVLATAVAFTYPGGIDSQTGNSQPEDTT